MTEYVSADNEDLPSRRKRFPDGIPQLDPVEDMQIEDEGFTKLLRKIETLEDQMAACPAMKVPRSHCNLRNANFSFMPTAARPGGQV